MTGTSTLKLPLLGTKPILFCSHKQIQSYCCTVSQLAPAVLELRLAEPLVPKSDRNKEGNTRGDHIPGSAILVPCHSPECNASVTEGKICDAHHCHLGYDQVPSRQLLTNTCRVCAARGFPYRLHSSNSCLCPPSCRSASLVRTGS